MDISLINTLVASLKTTYDIGVTAVGLRDANQFALAISEINTQLLKSQEDLFTLRSMIFSLQEQLIDAKHECLNLKAAAQDRTNYMLVKLPSGNFALQSKVDAKETLGEAMHYICQPCYGIGRKVVLQFPRENTLKCPVCGIATVISY